jgi:hypothetical protein
MRGTIAQRCCLVKLVAGVFLAISSTWPAVAERAAQDPIDDPDVYAVYASLLPNEWSVRVAHATTLVFQEETGTNWQCMPSGKALEKDWRPVVDSFRSENAKVKGLRPGFPLVPQYIVVPSAEIQASFRDVPNDPMFGWSGFYNRYPDSGGYMVVSSVGFDMSKTRAMVYMAHWCGTLCGGGSHHLLEKVEGVWREARIPGVSNCTWDS